METEVITLSAYCEACAVIVGAIFIGFGSVWLLAKNGHMFLAVIVAIVILFAYFGILLYSNGYLVL